MLNRCIFPILATLVIATPLAAQAAEPGITHACGQVLGLSPADEDFRACVASLGDSVARVAYFQAQNRANQAAAAACAHDGVTPGQAGYAMCVYRHVNATVTVGDAPALAK